MFEPKNNWLLCGDVGMDSLGLMLVVEIELIFVSGRRYWLTVVLECSTSLLHEVCNTTYYCSKSIYECPKPFKWSVLSTLVAILYTHNARGFALYKVILLIVVSCHLWSVALKPFVVALHDVFLYQDHHPLLPLLLCIGVGIVQGVISLIDTRVLHNIYT